ncbi:MAG TPA: UDP-N-acetylmuramoyl-tripeptide--D-alanyl-D-alanine ligase [Phycisphaerales bacterium]|nr:UDP-N-acetylmuramoyl-tripeptide--D-alanyl-D-alanine ligase [Phycisphaerales bacterium]
MFWTAASLAHLLAARWLTPATDFPLTPGVCTDTRAIAPGKLFIALRGEKHDAHNFLAHAITGGAPLLLIDREEAFTRIHADASLGRAHVLLVPDTAAALLTLAKAYRTYLGTLGATFIAVGGSNGKTSTVRMLHAALSQSLRGSSSQKSFNNAIGVPLTILAAREDDQFVICEVGTNAPGELEPLSRVVQPDIVVFTSLGREHLEGLGSLQGVADEEARLVTGIKPHGTIIAPRDGDASLLLASIRTTLAAEAKPATIITFGTTPTADIAIASRTQTFDGLRCTLADGLTFSLPVLGLHNATNAAATLAATRTLRVPDFLACQGLASVHPPAMRLERHTIPTAQGPIRVINDAYNANPDSMLAAIATLREIADQSAPTRLVFVLGDMLELGAHAPASHNEVIAAALAAKPDALHLLGPLMTTAAQGLATTSTTTTYPATTLEACEAIAATLHAGDLVLLKGSRGTAVERVLKALQSRHAAQNSLT